MNRYDDDNKVLLNCGEQRGCRTYCVWFGPYGSDRPVFVVASESAAAEFKASMMRISAGYSYRILKTTVLAQSYDDDKNPDDRYSHILGGPRRGRLFRVWMQAHVLDFRPSLGSISSSLVVRADDPSLVVPLAINDSFPAHVVKVTELPCSSDEDEGKECGNPANRIRNTMGKIVGEPEYAGEFDVFKYANFFDARKLNENKKNR